MLPVVVLAGGLGRRVQAATRDVVPKVLVNTCGRPFLDFKLLSLQRSGAREVVLLLGRHGDQVESHVGDGSRFGLKVDCRHDGPQLLGTGGSVAAALCGLPERFWVTYGDTLLDFDVAAAESRFSDASSFDGLMTVLHNENRWGRSNVRVGDGFVISYGEPADDCEFIDYGMIALRAGAFAGLPKDEPFDLGVVFRRMTERRRLGAFEVAQRFHEIGTFEVMQETESYLRLHPESFGL